MDSAAALNELKQFQGSRKSAQDYYTQYQNELGAGNAQQHANDLRGLIRNTETALKGVEGSVTGRTQGSLVTEAQRSRLANLERQPLQEGLTSQQGAYSDEMASYRDLVGQAGTRANMAYQTDADRLAALQGNYTNLFSREQADQDRRFRDAQAAEARRQFDVEQSRLRAGSGGGFNPSLNQPKAAMQQRNGGGFNFVDASGNPVSAARYASLTGQSIGNVLQAMGQSGDQYAAQLYNQLKSDPFFGRGDAEYEKMIKSAYNPIFWGT